MLKDIFSDLVRTEQVTKEVAMRRFISIAILYGLAFVLGLAILLIGYYKFFL